MKVPSNKISDIRTYYTHLLAAVIEEREARFMLDSIIAHFTGIPRLELAINPDNRVGESLLLKIHFAVKELKTNKPLQYVLGETEFNGLRFFVDESVLVPRPETEGLVEMVIEENRYCERELKILDIGTGSGCIAVSLAKELKSDVYAVDIDSKSLAIAQKNTIQNNVDITFIKSDVLNVEEHDSITSDFDIVISNPPYVRAMEKKMMQENVLDFEPGLALFVDDHDPLVFYKAISRLAVTKLKTNGVLWFEINEYLVQETKLLVENYFAEVKVINDYKDQARFIRAKHIT